MKKLGLRAVAGSLAVLMVASAFAPAKAASAADMLVTAKAPKTLVLTADMVDDDGEIVISNEDWDRIVVENGVNAKTIYFDGVEVDELVVESGSKTKVQLWDVDAAQVTVQEPEFEEVTLKDILPLLADKETQQAALNMYLENKQAVAAAKKCVPTIYTKEGAKVDTLVARANANLDLADGDVAVVALEASDKVDRATVTLKNYKGDVEYKGNDKFSSMTLKNVNSTVSLTVNDSTDKNFFTVTGKNSLVEKAEIAGNAKVALDAPMGTVGISEKASAAQVTILDSVDALNVDAKGAKVELTMNADVALATVTADNVKVEGAGTLTEAKLEGKGAYVSTNGTKVEGTNTYVKPVYVEKPEDIEYLFGTLGAGGWGFTRLGAENGGEVYKLNAGWGGEVFYKLPKSVDTCLYSEAVIKVKTGEGEKVTVKLTAEGAEKDSWGNPVPFYSKEVTGEVELVVPLTLQAGKMIDQVRFQSSANAVTATLYDVKFKLNPNGPVDPIVPPADGTLCTPNTWEVVKLSSVDFRQFAGKTVKITLEAIRLGGEDHLANGQFCNPYTVIHWQKAIGSEWTDFGTEAWEVPAEWADLTSPVNYGIRTVDGEDYTTSLIYYRNFSVEVVEGGETEDPTTTPEPEDPTTTPEPEDPTTTPEPEFEPVIGVVDLATKVFTSGEAPTESEGSLVFTAGNNKCAFNLPGTVKSGQTLEFTVDMDFTSLDVTSTARFYLIKDASDSAISNIAAIKTSELDSTSVNKTLTLTATADATQIMFVTFDWGDGDGNRQAMTLNGITCGAEEEEPEVTPTPTPEPTPEVTPVEDLVIYPGELQNGGWGMDVTVAEDGAVDYAATGTYKTFFYDFAETIDAASYEKVVFKLNSSANLALQLMATDAAKDDWGNPIAFVSKNCNSADVVEVEIPLDLYAGKQINRIAFSNQGDQPTGTVYSITFAGREDGPADPVVLPEDGTITTPNQYEVVLFNTVDFKDYAGKTVKITVEAMRVGGSVAPKVNASFTEDWGVGCHWGVEIGTEWTNFGADAFAVPEAWGTSGKSYYYGLRTIDGEDYTQSLFFYRNFSVEVVE